MKAFARLAAPALALAIAAATSAQAREAAMPVALPALPDLPSVGEQVVVHDPSGIALFGFDPVAYFAEGRAVGGSARHELVHEGLVWRFASAANRAAFERTPDIFKPAYGGYDPTGVAIGRTVETSPEHFAIIDARLHLFRTREARQRVGAEPDIIAAADRQWPAVQQMLAR
jgi:hypothetical protein